VNRVSVRPGNEPVPTGQRDIGARLLSPSEDRHFSNQDLVKVTYGNHSGVIVSLAGRARDMFVLGGRQVRFPRVVDILILPYFYSIGIAWLFFIRLLCRRIELAYCIAIVLISLNVWFNRCFR
jgi:hypothetical protein